MSLRSFHLIFILLAIVGADLFGLWAVWHFVHMGDAMILALGIISLLGGLGLIWYLIRFVRFLKEAHIE